MSSTFPGVSPSLGHTLPTYLVQKIGLRLEKVSFFRKSPIAVFTRANFVFALIKVHENLSFGQLIELVCVVGVRHSSRVRI